MTAEMYGGSVFPSPSNIEPDFIQRCHGGINRLPR